MDRYVNETDIEFLKFDLELARRIGVNEAIIFERIRHWCRGSSHVINGQRWIYNSFKQWTKQLPFSIRTIKTIVAKLEQLGLINVSEFNPNRYRRPNWYSVNQEKYHILRSGLTDGANAASTDTIVSADSAPSENAGVAPSLQRQLSETLSPEREDLSNKDFGGDRKEPLASETTTSLSTKGFEEEVAKQSSLSGPSEANSDNDEGEHDWKTFKRLEKQWMERVKSRVRLEHVAREMGVIWDSDGKVVCHGERTASLDIGIHNKQFEYRWFCFGECYRGGDQFDFVMKFGDMSLDEACEWMNNNVSGGRPKRPRGRRPLYKIPEHCRRYLVEHGIDYERLPRNIYYSTQFKGSWAIKTETGVCRRVFGQTNKYRNEKNTSTCLFKVGKDSDVVYLTEGVFDAVAIWQNTGFTAWSRTNGAGAFPEHLVPQFKGKTVYIPADNDKAGRKGALKITKMLEPWAKIQLIELPRGCKDPGEFFGKGGTAEQFRALIKKEQATILTALFDACA